jgi:Fic family protein
MYSRYVNIDLYISIHLAKEATQSSRIEGTQTRIEESFMREADLTVEKRDDWAEVQNYIQAMNNAIALFEKLPFSSRLIRETHKVLMQGVRGASKNPGEFRSSQNWIGGATINDARFVPPPHNEIAALMSDLEKFNDFDHPMPALLKIALLHYQFETIHPFLDGNGRVGRLLISLYLVHTGILRQPILYLSDFFERHRMIYYDKLMLARTNNDLLGWLKFFLVGVRETADQGVQTFDGIMQLEKGLDSRLKFLGSRAEAARKVVESLFRNPVTDVNLVKACIGKSNVTAYKLIASLESAGILQEVTGLQRNRIYVFREYLDLFENK